MEHAQQVSYKNNSTSRSTFTERPFRANNVTRSLNKKNKKNCLFLASLFYEYPLDIKHV